MDLQQIQELISQRKYRLSGKVLGLIEEEGLRIG